MHATLGNLLQFATEDTQPAKLNGSVYSKQIAKYGEWVNPDYPWFSDDPIMLLDDKWGNEIVENFNLDTLGSPVPVPINHTDDAKANQGKVLSVRSVLGDGLYADLEILDSQTVDDIDLGKIFDVSISFAWNHIRQDNNKSYGATLYHVALVNTPFLIGMKGFEKIGAALSRTLKPSGLSLAGADVIMLSRTKMKELSGMSLATIKNDKTFPVTVTYKDGEEDKTVVLQPDEEVEVPQEVSEEVTSQVSDAVEPTADEPDNADPKDDDAKDDEPKKESVEEELSRLRQENEEMKLSVAFDKLLGEGKVVPAQRDAVIGLAKLTKGMNLSTESGKEQDLTSVVLGILGTGAKKFTTEESGSSKEDPDADKDQSNDGKKPSEALTDEERAELKAVGADPAKMDEMAEKFPEAYASLEKK